MIITPIVVNGKIVAQIYESDEEIIVRDNLFNVLYGYDKVNNYTFDSNHEKVCNGNILNQIIKIE